MVLQFGPSQGGRATRRQSSPYYDPGYTPAHTDLLCAFRLLSWDGREREKVAATLAARSSTETWTEVRLSQGAPIEPFHARAYDLQGDIVFIAYPLDLFEGGSIGGILSVLHPILKEVRLEDICVPQALIATFPGPATGMQRERLRLGIGNRPLLGSIIKPRVGATAQLCAEVIYESLVGGLDFIKDDEALTSPPSCPWHERLRLGLQAARRAEHETGETKNYCCNITAASTREMLHRMEVVKGLGGRSIMLNALLPTGLASLWDVRQRAEELGLLIHCHHSAYAVLTDQHLSFPVLAKWVRLLGGDHMHIPRVQQHEQVVMATCRILRDTRIEGDGQLYFSQDFAHVAPVLPVAGGGLHAGHMPMLYRLLGNDALLLFGGATHGHPRGSCAGARAIRAAAEAVVQGRDLGEAADSCVELREALQQWRGTASNGG